MMPGGDQSSPAIPGNYINKVKQAGEFLRAYEMGGLHVQDPTGGLLQQLWTLSSDGQRIFLESPTQSKFVLLEDYNVIEIDLAFDQNMFPFVVYRAGLIVKFYWYDSVSADYVVSILGQFAISPRCSLDDKRGFNSQNSDIVLMYIDPLTLQLCYRLQRDRYEVIYILGSVEPGDRVRCVNMADSNRLQWTIDDVNAKPVEREIRKGMVNYTRPISTTGNFTT
jgi:hypothetical protein